MSIKSKGLIFAMEEDQVPVEDQVPAAQVEQVAVPAEVEAEVAQVVQDEAEVADLNTAIDEAVEDAQVLDQVAQVMDEAVEEGEGVDQTAAQIAQIAVESICVRLGIAGTKVLPAMESFGSSNSRVTATRIAVEGIKDTIVRLWESVKKAFASLMGKLKAFVANVFNLNTRLRNAALATQKLITAVGSKKASSDSIDLKIAAHAFSRDGKKTTGDDVKDILERHTRYVQELASEVESFDKAVDSLKEIVRNVKEVKADKAAADAKGTEVKADLILVADTLASDLKRKLFTEKQNDKDGFTSDATGRLVNNTVIVFTSKKASEASGQYMRVDEINGYEGETDSNVEVLNVETMAQVCELVISLTTENEKLGGKKDVYSKFEAKVNGLMEEALKVAKKIPGDENLDKAAADAMTELRLATSAVTSALGKVGSRIPALSVTASKVALNYIDACLKQYKAEEAAPKEEKAA